MRAVTLAALICAVSAPAAVTAQGHAEVIEWVDEDAATAADVAHQIWTLAELGYLETETSALLRSRLSEHGFSIETGVADIPTAFIASYKQGSGGPVIGILAEMDALPGISQTASPIREVRPERDASHACGHHLFGSGSVSAALVVKRWLEETGTPGEIRIYGTPAEEGGSGKVYMVRAGLFDDADLVLHWHPADENSANIVANLANRSARFRFTGAASHAAAAPEAGRSALDGVEAMNFMVNLMREHTSQQTRMHYVITRGGEAPNVVPDDAEVYYYVRHPNVDELERVWERVITAGEAAAMGTGVEMSYEIIHGNRPLLANEPLQRLLHANLSEVGGVIYDDAERRFAETIRESIETPSGDLGDEASIGEFRVVQAYGSTDVGDVSWVAPTGGMTAATWVPGSSAHSWQATAAGGMSIGHKGMVVAAKTLALTAVDLFADEELRDEAIRDFNARRGGQFDYYALLGEREPPLTYRVAD